MVKVYIDGQEGTTGLKILERFKNRNDIELLRIDEDKRKDPEERRKLIHSADFTFLCLPDAAAGRRTSRINQREEPRPLPFIVCLRRRAKCDSMAEESRRESVCRSVFCWRKRLRSYF